MFLKDSLSHIKFARVYPHVLLILGRLLFVSSLGFLVTPLTKSFSNWYISHNVGSNAYLFLKSQGWSTAEISIYS